MKYLIISLTMLTLFQPHSSMATEENVQEVVVSEKITKSSKVSAKISSHKEEIARILGVNQDDIVFENFDAINSNFFKKMHLLSCSSGRYLVIEFKKSDSKKKRIKEIGLAMSISEAGFGPEFMGTDDNKDFYIVRYIEHAISNSDLTDECLQNIGATIRKVHDFKFDGVGKSHSFLKKAKKHYKRAAKKGIAFPSGFDLVYNSYIKELETMKDTHAGFCHSNLNRKSIRISDDGKTIKIIDWSVGSGVGDCYEDLGYVVKMLGLSAEQIRSLLTGYGKDISEDEVVRYSKNAAFLTSVVCFDSSEDKDEKKTPIETRTANLDKMLNDPNLVKFSSYCENDSAPHIKSNDKMSIKRYALSAYKEYIGDKATVDINADISLVSKFRTWIKSVFGV